jgi:hypothetical protein
MNQALFGFTDRSIRLSDIFQVLPPFCFAFDMEQDRTPGTDTMAELRGDLALLSLRSPLAALTPAIILGGLVYH